MLGNLLFVKVNSMNGKRRIKGKEQGQGLVEYALLMALVAAVVVLSLTLMGISVRDALAQLVMTGEAPAETAEEITVTVLRADSSPVEGVYVYAYDEALDWRNLYGRTDANGQKIFEQPPEGTYVFLVYQNGRYYWSRAITFPREHEVVIRMETAGVTVTVVDANGRGIRNLPVYAMTANGRYYNGIYDRSDSNGRASLDLPAGEYRFMTYYSRSWYTSITIDTNETNSAELRVAQSRVTVNVADGDGQPLRGVRVYAFNEGSYYLNATGVTNSSGSVSLRVAVGAVKFRVDYDGESTWSPVISTDAQNSVTITISQ